MTNDKKIKELEKQKAKIIEEITCLQNTKAAKIITDLNKIPKKILQDLTKEYDDILYSSIKVNIPMNLEIFFCDYGDKLDIDTISDDISDENYHNYKEVKNLLKQKRTRYKKLISSCKQLSKQYKVDISSIYSKIGIFE